MKVFIGSGCTENYLNKSLEYLVSLNSAVESSNVGAFFVTLGFDMPEFFQKTFKNIRFVRKEFDDVTSLPNNFCLQHGDFLPIDFIEDDDVIVYTDVGDVIVQRLFNKEEWEKLNSLCAGDVMATWNAGEFDSLKAEYERLQPVYPLDSVEAYLDINARHFPCYNTGVIAAKKSVWKAISQHYAEHWDYINACFGHWAKQQWLLSYIFTRYFNVKIMPKFMHVHGKYGIPEWMGAKEILDNKQICFRHGLPKKVTVLALYPLESGTGYWRMKLWIKEMRKKHLDKIEIYEHDFNNVTADMVFNSQIVYIHGLADAKYFLLIQQWKHPASKFVFDICDNMLKIDESNPAYEGSKTLEHEIGTLSLLKNCDMLVCTTERLLEEYTKPDKDGNIIRKRESTCAPDSIDSDQWEKWFKIKQNMKYKKEYQDGFIRIGWHGGCSHEKDFEVVSEAIADVLKKYPNLKMQFIGWTPDKHFFNFVGLEDKIEYVEWDKPEMFGKNLVKIDIGLAPLVIGSEFNDAKSPIKWMEYSMLGIPCIASNSIVYNKVIEDGVTGYLVENTKDAWVKKISELIDNPELRNKIGRAAKERVIKKHSLKTNLHNWEKIIGV